MPLKDKNKNFLSYAVFSSEFKITWIPDLFEERLLSGVFLTERT
jgi:hypothetical protein